MQRTDERNEKEGKERKKQNQDIREERSGRKGMEQGERTGRREIKKVVVRGERLTKYGRMDRKLGMEGAGKGAKRHQKYRGKENESNDRKKGGKKEK